MPTNNRRRGCSLSIRSKKNLRNLGRNIRNSLRRNGKGKRVKNRVQCLKSCRQISIESIIKLSPKVHKRHKSVFSKPTATSKIS